MGHQAKLGPVIFDLSKGSSKLLVTFKVGGEAEDVIVVLLLVSQAIATDAWQRVLAPAGLSGDVNRILNASIAQPPGIAPVQLSLPCVMQLIEGCHGGVLVSACPLRIVEVQVVAAKAREIGIDDAYGSDMTEEMTSDTDFVLFTL